MHAVYARNAHQALPIGLALLFDYGVREESRVGDVLRFPGPVITKLERPQERVIFHPWRDANPFFHLVEALWMLAGRDDLAALTPYVANMANFSDDGGVTQPGAYGARWRKHFGHLDGGVQIDQLNWAVKRLRANPNDRRVVIQMWDPEVDIDKADVGGADVPCNLSMIPWVMDGALHLTIFNRSNDIIWGLYGANAVHFSMCLEYLAGRLGLAIGTMTTLSNNFHAYVDKMPARDVVKANTLDPYAYDAAPYPLYAKAGKLAQEREDPEFWDNLQELALQENLRLFFDDPHMVISWPFLRHVALPMVQAHAHYKKYRGLERYEGALKILTHCAASDWKRAAVEWLERRELKFRRAADDGVLHEE